MGCGVGGLCRTRTGFLVYIKKGKRLVMVVIGQHLHMQFRDSSYELRGVKVAMVHTCTCILSSRVILDLHSSLERAQSPLSKDPRKFEIG